VECGPADVATSYYHKWVESMLVIMNSGESVRNILLDNEKEEGESGGN